MHSRLKSRVVKRPARSASPPRLPRGFWNDVVRDVAALKGDDALELSFGARAITAGMKSMALRAAARAGIKVSIAVCGEAMYLWAVGN